MAREHSNRIAELRKAKGLTQTQLADKLGIHTITLSKLERGKIQLHVGYMGAIADALGVDALDLLSTRPNTRVITIVGALQANGRFDDFRDENNDFDEFDIDIHDRPFGDDIGEWVIVEGDGCWPFFHDQDKLYFVPVVQEDAWAYRGRLVVVWTSSDEARAGFLVDISTEKGADIQPVNGRMIHGLNVHDLWVLGEVRFAFPAEQLSDVEPKV
ncbi:helix-turn-helix domain-containing protein [Aureimonas sp. AU22]|uniref:helix-turn-helix domain-containing protein n=1 Tax=Aureimonas sp. AU22 TaxID=1638162 RepID=UPI000782B744|nr:helix-turn-helix domain-containing protein [Aureimonas sp. AU22]